MVHFSSLESNNPEFKNFESWILVVPKIAFLRRVKPNGDLGRATDSSIVFQC